MTPTRLLPSPVLLLGLATFAPAARAQDSAPTPFVASPYLHLRHPLYRDIDLLVERGILTGLSPVVRPYTRAEIARAVIDANTEEASEIERALVERVERELRPEIQALAGEGGEGDARVAGEFSLEGTAMSQSHRDPLRPEGDGRVTGAAELDLRGTFAGIVAESRLRSDNYFLHDPQFPGRVATNRFNQRAEEAYVEFQGRNVRLMVGRLYRNWAPSGVQGTLLSDYAYSFDQASLWVGTSKVSFSLVTARLDDFPGDVRRYVALHRLDIRPSASLAFYGAEAMLYGGPGRNFELEFLNPLSFWYNENENQRAYRGGPANNAFIGAGFWWRARRSLIVFGDLTVDDYQVDPTGEPTSYAFYLGLVFPRVGPALVGRFTYGQVSNLSYRTPADFERYTFRNVGLARDFSDCDLFALEVSWLPTGLLRLEPGIQILRRGEGDLRQPWPSSFDGVETVLSGVVETTLRLSLGGSLQLREGISVDWDLGENFVRNRGHEQGERDSEFVGRVTARWRFGRAFGLSGP